MDPVVDDFERFCQIAKNYTNRDSLTPIIQITEPIPNNRMSIQTDSFLIDPNKTESLKRASSYRESRPILQKRSNLRLSRSPINFNPSPINKNKLSGPKNQNLHASNSSFRDTNNFQNCKYYAQNSKQSSPVKFENNLYKNNLPYHPNEFYTHKSKFCQDQNELYDYSPINKKQVLGSFRQRPGSMREYNIKNNNYYSVSRPSAPTLSPTICSNNFYSSSSRHSIAQPDEHTVRVRRFEQNKHGQIINKGDQNILQTEPYLSNSISGDSRLSIPCSNKISTFNQSNHVSESSLSDNEIIEIPAITKFNTNLSPNKKNFQNFSQYSKNMPNYLEPMYNKRKSSPLRNKYSENCLRSKSMGTILDKEKHFHNLNDNIVLNKPRYSSVFSNNQQCTKNKNYMFLNNELLNIQILGAPRVGKTSVCMQFQTSESIEDTNDSCRFCKLIK